MLPEPSSYAGSETRGTTVGRRGHRWLLAAVASVAAVATLSALAWSVALPNWRPPLRTGERYGVDVSHHQGRTDWDTVAADGIEFVYVKATEGGDHRDTRFGENTDGARSAGLDVGAYHFFTLCRPGTAQANWFLAVAPPTTGALPPAVDLELAGNCSSRPDAGDVAAQVDAFVEQVETAWGVPFLLYVGNDWEARYPTRARLDRPLWQKRGLRRPQVTDPPVGKQPPSPRMVRPDPRTIVLSPFTPWTDVDDLHRQLAELDAPDPAPHLIAYEGDTLLMAIRLRPFAKGAYEGPIVEAMALALPMGADRVSLALPGRAWSMDDPIPPVTGQGDLRQRVLTQCTVDGHDVTDPVVRMALHPFVATDEPGGDLQWQPSLDPGPGEGWIPDAMGVMVDGRQDIAADATPSALLRQAERLDTLGHLVVLSPAGHQRLGVVDPVS